jgi:uncharacterized flavoprotein (TIGR03862 family)
MEELEIVVIGGGPAGLRAAEIAASLGRSVTIFDGKPSMGRKFLVAGKGGLNLTHGEAFETLVTRYTGGEIWSSLIEDFDNEALREWCHGLGLETFQASSGRVYPKALKGAPVLRAWLARLRANGVDIRPNHRWETLLPGKILQFSNGTQIRAKAIIFALGGASWPKTGSDGGWLPEFVKLGIACEPLTASNCGWECEWPSEVLARAEGQPLKNISVKAGNKQISGELLITCYGLEGGSIYALGSELRGMTEPRLEIDFKPTFTAEQLLAKIAGAGADFFPKAIRAWKLSTASAALLSMHHYQNPEELVRDTKSFWVSLLRPRPIVEAISSAGGVSWSELDENLMLKQHPGIYLCGEMISWDAPTGGYLLQAAFATGTRVGKAAAKTVL